MSAQFLQFLFAGLTVGAIYALAGLGYALVYSASGVINFAQGQFVMLGAMATVGLLGAGLPYFAAVPVAIIITIVVGMLAEKLAVRPAHGSSIVTLIVITLGVGELIKGSVQVVLDRSTHTLPSIGGGGTVDIAGAFISTQGLWVIGVTFLCVLLVGYFLNSTLTGKAMRAVSCNRLAAQLVGIKPDRMLLMSFAISAALGAIGGILITPISFISYDSGTMIGLKGFVAAALGGLGNAPGAIVGGLVLGLLESFTAGYISSAYKDAVAFILIILVFFVTPNGLFGAKSSERV
ncbi:branched-chain amino acid ABC transporter permease [Mesorhizobium sp. CAU 1741]|uniref:branched-chain amino acid ABC transporter permease n=1 Tax=Mesorhizobium sp. CAU 1741 TaxID=3140366 RepID=UPI00325B7707